MTKCPRCSGSGFIEVPAGASNLTRMCQQCKGTGYWDQREHEDGGADGLGGCRGILSALTIALGFAALWILTGLLG